MRPVMKNRQASLVPAGSDSPAGIKKTADFISNTEQLNTEEK
jgi:hypothetical protein